jgi:hypothetical protein
MCAEKRSAAALLGGEQGSGENRWGSSACVCKDFRVLSGGEAARG